MKLTSQILLVLTVLAISVKCVPPADNACDTLDTAFIKYLATLTPSPVLTSGTGNAGAEANDKICNTVWSTGIKKACCDPSKLQVAITTITKPRTDAWKAFNAGVANFNKNYKNINRLLYSSTLVASDITTIAGSDAKKAILSGLGAQSVIGAITTFNSSYLTALAAYIKDGAACYKLTMDTVTNTVCLGCAAAADDTRIAATTGAVTLAQASGNALFAACSTTWQFIDTIGLASDIIAAINNQRGGDAPKAAPTAPYFGSTLNTETKMMPEWVKCAGVTALQTGDGKCTQAVITTIVDAHYHTTKPVPRLSSANLIDASYTKGNTIEGNTIPANSSASTNSSAPASGSGSRRMLVLASAFTGDAVTDTTGSGGAVVAVAPAAGEGLTFTALDLAAVTVPTKPSSDDLLYGSGTGSGTAPPSSSDSVSGSVSTSTSFVTMFSTIAITMITMLNLN